MWLTVASASVWLLAFAAGLRREPVLRCAFAAAAGAWLAGAALQPAHDGCFLPSPGGSQKRWVRARVLDASAGESALYRVRADAWVEEGGRLRRSCGALLVTISGLEHEPMPGESVRLHASLRRPRNFANPGAYDHETALARRGVWMTAFASAMDVEPLAPPPPSGALWIATARARLRSLIDRSLPARRAALMRALILGEAAAVPPPLREAIARAGLVHLLSVSGLHVGLVWGAAFLLVRALASRSERLLLAIDVRALAASVALIPAGAYGVLAGSSLPTERTVAMTVLSVVAMAVSREVAILRLLVLAAAVLSLVHPGSPGDVSFQLSFGSVLALGLGAELAERRRRRRPQQTPHRVREYLVAAFVASSAAVAGTAPLVALYFQWVTPIGLLTNPLLVPLCGAPATVLGLGAAAVALASDTAAAELFRVAGWPLELLASASEIVAALPFASFRVPMPSLLELALAYGLLALPWIRRRRRAAAAALLLLLAVDVGAWLYERCADPTLRLRFLDVGQGDAIVVELPRGGVLLVDAGGFRMSSFDPGERVVAPYLWSRKVLRLQAIAATHGDWDHQGGLHFVAREFRPRALWTSDAADEVGRLGRLEHIVRQGGGIVRRAGAGEVLWRRDDTVIECVHPGAASTLSGNDASLVLRLRIGRIGVLLTGDVEEPAERQLLHRGFGRVAVLKVAHHGSLTSSSAAFVNAAAPSVAVISVGGGNPFGMPRAEVLARYRRRGTRVLRTDVDGAVLVESDGEGVRTRAFADSQSSFCRMAGVC
ncbi:MAG: competence protein ComEC [Candidatus Binatota bacterium]|nr:competence protein ComEC [Candidatus Binatota bacterium]